MRPRAKLVTLGLACVAALVVAAVAVAAVAGLPRGTAIISPPGGSPASDGPSDSTAYTDDGARAGSSTPAVDPIVNTPRPMDNLEFSQDNRQVRYAAFDSLAGMAGTQADGHHHVYLFKRRGGGKTTAQVLDGQLVRIDPNAGGDSVKPSLDGQTLHGNRATTPHCVVFQSTSMLTSNDSSANWSIYLYDVKTKSFTLISPQGADARDGVVDGKCRVVTFEQGGQVYVRKIGGGVTQITKSGKGGFNPDMQTDGKGVAYDREGQVYYRSFGTRFRKGIAVGGEKLVSINSHNRPGNGSSEMPAVNDNGAYIAFESKATDLCDGTKTRCGTHDANGDVMDVFRRTMPGKKAPTKDVMEMISYDGKERFQSDLESDQVKITGAGEQACFRSFGVETHNHKFRPDRHTGPFQHIYFWNFPRERMIGAFSGESKEGRSSNTELQRDDGTAAFNWSCAISSRGNFIGFSSDTEHMAGDVNGHTTDMFIRFMGGSDEGLGGDLG
jgi:hypothetical protein